MNETFITLMYTIYHALDDICCVCYMLYIIYHIARIIDDMVYIVYHS